MDSKIAGQQQRQLMHIPKKENSLDIDWYCMELEETFEQISQLPPLQSFFGWESLVLPWQMDHGLKGFEDIDSSVLDNNLATWDEDIMIDRKPLLKSSNFVNIKIEPIEISDKKLVQRDDCESNPSMKKEENKREMKVERKRASNPLQLEEIQKHFDVPITKAAKAMKVGLTVLKKRCRELNIRRWPHRKIRSLKSLISNVKEMGLTNELVMLEEHKKLVEKAPDMELTEKTKRLRQVCFKANYKKRRCLAAHS